MQRARLALVVAGSAALVLGLAGCTKPNPGASAFSGTNSVYEQAVCWAPEGQYLDAKTCGTEMLAGATSELPVLAGQTIGISVDPVVADQGWFPVLGGQRVTANAIKQNYFRFTPTQEQLGASDGTLAVVSGDDKGTKGIWVFRLTQ
jgi:hypothetical protein